MTKGWQKSVNGFVQNLIAIIDEETSPMYHEGKNDQALADGAC